MNNPDDKKDYVVFWQYKQIPSQKGHGQPMNMARALSAVKWANKVDPEVDHWCEPVVDKDESKQFAQIAIIMLIIVVWLILA